MLQTNFIDRRHFTSLLKQTQHVGFRCSCQSSKDLLQGKLTDVQLKERIDQLIDPLQVSILNFSSQKISHSRSETYRRTNGRQSKRERSNSSILWATGSLDSSLQENSCLAPGRESTHSFSLSQLFQFQLSSSTSSSSSSNLNHFSFLSNLKILASNRGESEKVLRIHLEVSKEAVFQKAQQILFPDNEWQFWDANVFRVMQESLTEAVERLLVSLETQIRKILTERAQERAVDTFSCNLNS